MSSDEREEMLAAAKSENSGWSEDIVKAENGELETHLSPIDDFYKHLATGCWCNPTKMAPKIGSPPMDEEGNPWPKVVWLHHGLNGKDIVDRIELGDSSDKV